MIHSTRYQYLKLLNVDQYVCLAQLDLTVDAASVAQFNNITAENVNINGTDGEDSVDLSGKTITLGGSGIVKIDLGEGADDTAL